MFVVSGGFVDFFLVGVVSFGFVGRRFLLVGVTGFSVSSGAEVFG